MTRRKENQLGLTSEETSLLAEKLKGAKPEPGSSLEVLARALEGLVDHECTVVAILTPPYLDPNYTEWNLGFWSVKFSYTSPTLGEGETTMICTKKREAQEYQPGFKFKMQKNTGVLIN